MTNFVRLVQFARRYKVRFGLSIGCAVMVALLFFTELGAVYPLLHILFDSQNPQRWVAEKIAGVEGELLVLRVRRSEAQGAFDVAQRNPADFESLKLHFQALHEDFEQKEAALRKYQRGVGVIDPKENAGPLPRTEVADLEKLAARVSHRRSAAERIARMQPHARQGRCVGDSPAAPRY